MVVLEPIFAVKVGLNNVHTDMRTAEPVIDLMSIVHDNVMPRLKTAQS